MHDVASDVHARTCAGNAASLVTEPGGQMAEAHDFDRRTRILSGDLATTCHLKYVQNSPTNNNRRNNPRVTFSDGLIRIYSASMTSVAHPMARARARRCRRRAAGPADPDSSGSRYVSGRWRRLSPDQLVP